MARDLSTEPVFPTDEIQGDILVGLLKKYEKFVFFTVKDGEVDRFQAFLATLQITTMQECLDQRDEVAARKAADDERLVPTPGLNVAFTRAGLAVLGVEEFAGDQFNAGMAASGETLQDPETTNWEILRPNSGCPVHGVFLVTGSTESEVDNTIALRLAPAGDNGWEIVLPVQRGVVRPEPAKGHEHFGYADGVSQPAVRGLIADGVPLDPTTGADPDQAEPGRDLLWPGEFVFGYSEQAFDETEDDNDVTTEGESAIPEGDEDTDFRVNGAFLVFRRLRQFVPEFDLSVKKAAAGLDPTGKEPSADFLGAQLVGRWKSGAPLINAPHKDDPAVAEGTVGALDFEFDDDRQGLICPWAAHIRKAYPRDDAPFNIGPTREQAENAEARTQTHRMMRRGIAFGPELTEDEALTGVTTEPRGLLFACYVTDIADQFEFVQEQWVNNANFSQPGAGVDAIIGQSRTDATLQWTGGMPFDPNTSAKPELELARFVQMDGGEYFFAPSVSKIHDVLRKARRS